MISEPSVPKEYPIRTAFQNFYDDYKQEHSVTTQQEKAAFFISRCKTGELGYNISFCEHCGNVRVHACSCNHRDCPCCQTPLEQKWVMARNSELISGISYYHVVFTVPFELNDLIYANQTLLYDLMFTCVTETILTLCKDKRYMGATPGVITMLHTWGQQLNYHPHIHAILSGGGITKQGQFIECRHKGFLLPQNKMAKMFRGKFLSKLKMYYKKQLLSFDSKTEKLSDSSAFQEYLNLLYEKVFIPNIKETFNGNGNAIKYLGRYAYRTAISNSRISYVNDNAVIMKYKDYADHNAQKELLLEGIEFIHRFLMHILPKGFQRVRFSGYLCNCQKTKNLLLIHQLRGTNYEGNKTLKLSVRELILLLYQKDIQECSNCHKQMTPLPRGIPLSHYKVLQCSLTKQEC